MATSGESDPLDLVPHVLQALQGKLQKRIDMDKSLASRMNSWKPPLIGRSKMTEINSQVDRGLPRDAFRTWFNHAFSNYTTEHLEDFCKCLRRESEEEAKPKLLQVANLIQKEIDRLIALEQQCSTTHQSGEKTDGPRTQPSAVDGPRTEALREAHENLKSFYTEPIKPKKPGKVGQFIHLALIERTPHLNRKKDSQEFLVATACGIDQYSREAKNFTYDTILTGTRNYSGKRIVIVGSPGSGKTTLAHKLCRDLYSGHLPNQYQLVLFTELIAFRIYLKVVNKEASLLTLLEYSSLCRADNLWPMVEEEAGRNVAIILDGFDAISDDIPLSSWVFQILSHKFHTPMRKCDVFITTRPSQLTQLLTSALSVVEVLGFLSSDIEHYIKAYFEHTPDIANEVIRRLHSLPLVYGLCSNPRVLEIMCTVFEHPDEEHLPENQSSMFSRYLCYQLEIDLEQRDPPVIARIRDLLSVPQDLFPGFYTLCRLSYQCCLSQQLLLEEEELGEVKKYIDKRRSVYNLLFAEPVRSPSPFPCVLYKSNHKTVTETLAAVHIAVLPQAEQQQIWEEWFTAPHMALVWMMFCGLTGLKSVDLRRLFYLIVSEREREVVSGSVRWALKDENMLLMVSLLEANNSEEAKHVLPAMLKSTISADVKSHYDATMVGNAITQHPNLQTVDLDLHEDMSEFDLQPLTTSLKNVKAVELRCKVMEPMLAVLPRTVEDLSLHFTGRETSYQMLGDVLRDCHRLRSLRIELLLHYPTFWAEVNSVLNNSRLTEFRFNDDGRSIIGGSVVPSMETLRNLLVHREKCSLEMPLTHQQVSALLFGLKRADKLKELCLHIELSSSQVNPHLWLVTCAEVEELVATHPHLVKVDVKSTNYSYKSDLLIALVKGAIRNKNIAHLGLGEQETPAVHPLLCSPSADHITSIRACYRRGNLYDDEDVWSKAGMTLMIAGPMARQTCYLEIRGSTAASLGLLLSRVNTATKLKDLSLELLAPLSEKDEDLVDVRAVETAFLNCNLRKLRIKHDQPFAQWCRLYSAILIGLAANTTAQVDTCIYGSNFDVEVFASHLPQLTLQRFKIVRTRRWSFIISRDPFYPSDVLHQLPPAPLTQATSSEPTPGEDRFKEDYDKAVKAHGCINLFITKCTTIGPPRIGKTCLKHLLTETQWDANKEMPSTEAICAPEWVECFRRETDSLGQPCKWTAFSRKERILALYRSIKRMDYDATNEGAYNNAKVQPSAPEQTEPIKPTIPTAKPIEPTEPTVPTAEPTEPTVQTPAGTASKPDPSTLVPEEQMDTSPLNPPAVLASEAATTESDPTASEEYKLLNRRYSSLIPDKWQEDEKKKGRALHEMHILHFIDTGGQSMYHDVHPVLITSPSVYLVVFNLEKCFPALQADFLSSDLTQQALRSIHTLTSKEPWSSNQPALPKIFIVGTHLDKIPRCGDVNTLLSEPCLDKLHTEIEAKLKNMPYCNYIQYDPSGRCFWAVDNREAGKKTMADVDTAAYLAHLRELIVEKSMTNSFILPIAWLILEHLAADCKPIFEYKNIFQMALNNTLVTAKDEFDALLHAFHRLGLFFYEPGQDSGSNYVFVDPNELYTVTSKLFQRCKGRQPQAITRAAIKTEIATLSENVDNSEWLINLLCKLRLMAALGDCPDSQCVIPAILPDKPFVGSLLFSFIEEGRHQFSFLPSGLFCAFTAEIIRTQPEYSWTPLDMYRYEIFFNVGGVGRLKLTEYHSTIKIDLNLLGNLDPSVHAKTCQELKRCLQEVLKTVWSGFDRSKHSLLKFDKWAMWGVTCIYHRDGPERMQHLAKCIFNPMSKQWYSVCTSSPTGLFRCLSKEEELWFHNS